MIHHTQMYYLYSTIEVWKLKSQEYKKKRLTFDFHAHCAINRNTHSTVSCTSVCSICTSLDITQDIFSIHSWKWRCTVCTITFHFRPGDVWRWFTSCITIQSNQRALTNHLITRYVSNSSGHYKNNFSRVTGLQCRLANSLYLAYVTSGILDFEVDEDWEEND